MPDVETRWKDVEWVCIPQDGKFNPEIIVIQLLMDLRDELKELRRAMEAKGPRR